MNLQGERVTLRPQTPEDIPALNEIVAMPGVSEIWGPNPEMDDQDAFTVLVDGEIAGWLGWYEETDEMYRHGGLDIFLAPKFQNRGLGTNSNRSFCRQYVSRNAPSLTRCSGRVQRSPNRSIT